MMTMMSLTIRMGLALAFWIIGLKALNSFIIPVVEKYAARDAMAWIFAGFSIWSVGWVIVVCVISYHITLKTLSCIWYRHDQCRSSK